MNWIQLLQDRDAEHISCDDLTKYGNTDMKTESLCGIKAEFYIGFDVHDWVVKKWEMRGCDKCIELAKLIENL